MSKKNYSHLNNHKTNNQKAADSTDSATDSKSLSSADLTIAKSEGAEQPVPLTRQELFEGSNEQASNSTKAPEESATDPQADADEPTMDNGADAGSTPPPDHPRKGLFGNGKMFAAGVALLVLAGCMFVFLWNHAKVTQAESIAYSQRLLNKIYTSPAHRDITKFANLDQLTKLQTAVNQMAQSKEKNQLQKQHDIALDMVTIRSGYVDLYNNNSRFSSAAQPKEVTAARYDMRHTWIYKNKLEPYFIKKYQGKLAYADRVLKHAINRHRAVQKLYKNNGKIKAKYASYDITDLLLTLKYSQQSELEHSDRARLIRSRKHLYKIEAQQRAAEASSAAAESALEAAQSSLLAAQQSSSDSSISGETSSSDSTDSTTAASSSYSIISSTPTTNAENSTSTSTPTTGTNGISNGSNSTTSSEGNTRYSNRTSNTVRRSTSSSTTANR